MPRRRRYYPTAPPAPDPTHFIVCHPLDSWRVRFDGIRQERQHVVITERCPPQHVIHLPLRLLALAESGAWFDSSPDAEWIRGAIIHWESRPDTIEGTDKPRCMAMNADSSWCARAAVDMPAIDLASTYTAPGPCFCSAHGKKRKLIEHKPGDGLESVSANPLSDDTLGELSVLQHRLHNIGRAIRSVQEEIFSGDQALRLGEAFADLHDVEQIIKSIVSGDRERDSKLRSTLRTRIQRMVERICLTRQIEGWQVHTAYKNAGGKPQNDLMIEELKAKVNWLFINYADVFPVDTREWESNDDHVTGREPGGIRVKGPEDPIIETEA